MRHVHTEAVGTVVGPEADGLEEILAHVRIVPVPVGLFDREQMQVPLTVLHACPGGAAEAGGPVGGRQFAVLAAAVAEDVAVAFGVQAGPPKLAVQLVGGSSPCSPRPSRKM